MRALARQALYVAIAMIVCLFVAACGGAEDDTPDSAKRLALEAAPIRVYQEGDALWVELGDTRQMLADDGMSYDAHVSADGRRVAVDVAILSTVQVTRLFVRSEDGRYEPAANLSGRAWDTIVATRDGLSIADIERPRTRFVGWSEDGGVRVEVRGEAPDGVEILETLVVPAS